jgi:hypothetical protein
MPSVVLDANVPIGLVHGDVFDLLRDLYAPVYVSPAVVHEVVVQGHGRTGAGELQQALGQWITEVSPAAHRVQRFSPPLPRP